MLCPRCQQGNPVADAQFCPRCGAPAHAEESATPPASYADLRRELTEAREQQTATSEILRVISRSRTDLQAVLETVLHSAGRLCAATFGALQLFDGERLTLDAHYGISPADVAMLQEQVFPMYPDRGSTIGRAVLSRAVVHVADIRADPDFRFTPLQTREGYRTALSVPMFREGVVVGVINLWRRDVRPFSASQVSLVETFADQAVIAIENVRLFAELQARNRDLTETLAQQAGTAEVLKVISSSPTDLQRALNTLTEAAARLCGADHAAVYRLEDRWVSAAAFYGPVPGLGQPLGRGSVVGRAMVDRRTTHVHDLAAEPDAEYPEGKAAQRRLGHRTVVATPLLREGQPIGALALWCMEVRPFSDKQIALLQTFADQAVIAIENVRLFKELEARNRDLTTALDQQTATSDILRVISQSQTDVQPVFDTIVQSAARLCHAASAGIFLTDGRTLDLPANYGSSSPEALATIRAQYPRLLDRETTAGVAILTRSVIHVPDIEAPLAAEDYTRRIGRLLGVRSMVAVPMMRKGELLGAINLSRREPGGFSDMEVELLKTFADQAVIAIENVRLFKELEARNRDLTESLEQQTATSEILRVISSSPTDVQPVFEAIVQSAERLCGGQFSVLCLFDGELVHFVAHHNLGPEALAEAQRIWPTRPARTSGAGRAILERRVVQIHDIETDPEYGHRQLSRAVGHRSSIYVPMLKDDTPVGVIVVARVEPGQFADNHVTLLQTFADQAVIAIENVRLFTELKVRNKDLTDALQRETAAGEVLRLISSSPTDVAPVFDGILRSASRLAAADYGATMVRDGEFLHLASSSGTTSEWDKVAENIYPLRVNPDSVSWQAIRERRPVFIEDAQGSPLGGLRDLARTMGYRSILMVPMLRQDVGIGVLALVWQEARAFPSEQLPLLQTFADQAVIAIENVRLFKELEARNRDLTEALEQQTATSEILRVISRTPTAIQPVFEAIAESARRLCDGNFSAVATYDGEVLQLAAHAQFRGEGVEAMTRLLPTRPRRDLVLGRVILDGAVVHIPDALADAEYDHSLAEAVRFRSIIGVPMLREGTPIGAITVSRAEVRPFTQAQITLLKTFADQAVIAIENVRLFKELEVRNTDLTEALEQQTATAEILRVISQSQTDVQPVFDTIIKNALRLCGAQDGSVFRFDGELIHLVASETSNAEFLDNLHRVFPRAPGRDSPTARAILTGAVTHVPDIAADPDYEVASIFKSVPRTILSVPMVRDGQPIGAITVARRDVRPFADKQIALLQTFADQAVIAIENARLLNELQARTDELTRSVEQLTALGEVGRAVSSTLDLETVLTTIVSRAVQLSGLDGGVVFEYDDGTEEFVQRAATESGGTLAEVRRATRIRKGEGVVGRTAIILEPVQVPDITIPGTYESRLRENLVESGIRAILAVPMVREGHLIGCLGVTRNQPGDFPNETIDLLRTFATQSALAIQNARLFHEIAAKSRQLEAASQHKSEFLANMSHELRTPLNAIIGFSEVLNDRMFGELNDKQAEYLKDIYASGQHLLSLINDILDLSKIEAGRMELEAADFDLPSAIDNALILVRERATRRGITLGRTIDDRLGIVRGDERKVKQVLLNLLSNALKFTPEGGRIDVSAHLQDDAAEIAVADTGVGIAPEDQGAIFEEFRQVGTADKKVEGTGLGLALSRKFIELHGGRIWVKSQVGHGSTFTFTLPVRRGE